MIYVMIYVIAAIPGVHLDTYEITQRSEALGRRGTQGCGLYVEEIIEKMITRYHKNVVCNVAE